MTTWPVGHAGMRGRLIAYGLGILAALGFLLIGTTPQAMADPGNWVNLVFWTAVLLVLVFFFVKTIMRKPQPKPV